MRKSRPKWWKIFRGQSKMSHRQELRQFFLLRSRIGHSSVEWISQRLITMLVNRKIFFLFTFSALLFSCSEKTQKKPVSTSDQKTNEQLLASSPPINTNESFELPHFEGDKKKSKPSATANPPSSAPSASTTLPSNSSLAAPLSVSHDSDVLILKKSSLKKTFLLSPSVVASSNMPLLQHLAPKVIVFEKHGDQLAMIEQNYQSLYQDLPSDKLLQTFKIESENNEAVQFRWKLGLEYVPTEMSISTVSDEMSEEDIAKATNENETIKPQIKNFVQQMELKKESLTIKELVRLRGEKNEDSSALLFYEIKPYQAHTKFKSRVSKLSQGIGFFEVFRANLYDQEPQFLAQRWDLSDNKKLTYAITKGADPDIVEAAKEGILYWNKVFGSEVLRVETDVDPLESPQERRVLVHWIPWKSSGFAVASLQADPITGEILKGNVYMTSYFAYKATETIVENIDIRTSKQVKALNAFVPKGFKPQDNCFYPFENLFLKDFSLLSKKARQDYVRLIVSHEVGHTLGLRHNFSGSFDAEVHKPQDIEALRKEYLSSTEKLSAGAAISTSVMDYVFDVQGLILGAAIKRIPLTYDKKAIEWGYSENEKNISDLQAPLFCTDIERMSKSPYGCDINDVGTNPIYHWAQRQIELKNNFIKKFLFNRLTNQISKLDARNNISFQQALLSLKEINLNKLANSATNQLAEIMNVLKKETPLVIKNLEYRKGENWSNKEKLADFVSNKIKNDLAEVNGLKGLMKTVLPLSEKSELQLGWLKDQVEELYKIPWIQQSYNLLGMKYTLSANELAELKKVLLSISEKLEEKMVLALINTMTFKSSDSKKAVVKKNIGLENSREFIAQFVNHLVFSELSEDSETLNGVATKLPHYKYPIEIRVNSLSLLSQQKYSVFQWQNETIKQIKTAISKKLEDIAKMPLTDAISVEAFVKVSTLSKKSQQWFLEQSQLLAALDALESEIKNSDDGSEEAE